MNDMHPNLALLQRLKPGNFTGDPDLFAEDVVFHYYNSKLPDLHGDYAGIAGIQTFFEKLGIMTKGSFRINPVSASAVGDELVVTQSVNSLSLGGNDISIDVIVVWRIVDNKIKEIWDIPSTYTQHEDIDSN